MSIVEVRDVETYTNLQLRNKINKMLMKIDKLSDEEKKLLETMKKEAWKRGMDDVF